ncbi:hypothetical protein Y032_0019g3914 [Ancylostoma ceylanicum]|uniref:Uncharacterized protein n=1 Tax=Ancylostoma ceylanicum TaxID=53326 RepID=A0A016V2D6_9BILA|nr:hypothetical protein Y032_0019g3914 [Ancylostoma ceylanicum]
MPHSATELKFNIENALTRLQWLTKRTIVSIIAMWKPQFLMDVAESSLPRGSTCILKGSSKRREQHCEEYAKVVYEIQDERNFDSKDFTVVVQGFLEGAHDGIRDVNF